MNQHPRQKQDIRIFYFITSIISIEIHELFCFHLFTYFQVSRKYISKVQLRTFLVNANCNHNGAMDNILSWLFVALIRAVF